MSEPDRPATSDPSDENWPQVDDPEVTRVVPRMPTHSSPTSQPPPADAPPAAADTPDAWPTASAAERRWPEAPAEQAAPAAEPRWPEAPAEQAAPAIPPAAGPGWPAPADGPDRSGEPAPAGAAAGEPGPPAAGHTWPSSQPTPAVSGGGAPPPGAASYGSPSTGAAPTAYIGAPTTVYQGPDATGPQQYPNGPTGGYAYQPYQGMPGAGAGPQVITPPPATNVVLPPVRMPKAESRVMLNLLGSVIGILLVGGGLTLTLLYAPKMRADVTGGTLDVLAVVLTIVGAILVAGAAVLSAWASWAALVPGFLLSAASIWAMITVGPNSGGRYITDATRWAFSDGRAATLCADGVGVSIGLLLFAAGLAAVLLRAGVRRTIRQQLDSIQD